MLEEVRRPEWPPGWHSQRQYQPDCRKRQVARSNDPFYEEQEAHQEPGESGLLVRLPVSIMPARS